MVSELVEWLETTHRYVWDVANREGYWPSGKQLTRDDWDRVAGEADSELVSICSPASTIARIEAEREILALHVRIPGDGVNYYITEQDRATDVIRSLAWGWRHMPGWKREWTP